MVIENEPIRLQKLMAQAGVASRRMCEDLISQGRVKVNGEIVSELGARAHSTDRIEVDGVPILSQDKVVYAFNKPLGVVSAMHDDRLPHLGDFCLDLPFRVFHIGRLDVDSEGLILLTNDGELAERISHPRNEISKTYQLEIEGQISPGLKKRLLAGIQLEDGASKLDSIKVKASTPQTSLVEVQIHSGKNRILRRMFDEIGHPILRLIRTRIGHFTIGTLKPGELRKLSYKEIEKVFEK